MKWLLDTCVVSELNRQRPDPVVLQWLRQHEEGSTLCTVTVGEILHGIERLPASAGRNRLQVWFETLHQRYARRTLDTTDLVWRTYARLRASVESMGRPQDDLDLLIAATASVHGLTLVTRNTRHFEDTGVPIVNPWDAP